MDLSGHWDAAYGARGETALTWFEEVPEVSLRLVRQALPSGGRLVDVGGGASRLVDHALAAGAGAVTVLDLSAQALEMAKARVGDAARLIVSDVRDWVPDSPYDVWHDRAAFHFLTETQDQARYLATLDAALVPGGTAIIATFDLTGPETCSNLPVQRYSPQTLAARVEALAPGLLTQVQAERHDHRTPRGNLQAFQTTMFRKGERRR